MSLKARVSHLEKRLVKADVTPGFLKLSELPPHIVEGAIQALKQCHSLAGQEVDEEGVRSLSIPWTRYVRVTPTARQLAFLLLDCREALYGGSAGGGKSLALLMAALQYVSHPHYSALLLRRTYADLSLPGALMDVAHRWLQRSPAKWSEVDKTWTFPSGASLTFGYLAGDADKYRYQSAQFQYIGFDELTQFQEADYRYLFSRLRRPEGSDIPTRMRTASNPGGVGHEWVKQRFMVEPNPDRLFLSARLDDNPHIDRQKYVESLNLLDPVTREQLLNGDWTARAEGGKFKREWFTIVDSAPECEKVRYWDLAATTPKPGKDPDYTAGVLMGKSKDNVLYIINVMRMRGTPNEVESLVRRTAEMDGRNVKIRMEQEPGASGVRVIDDYQRRVLMGWAFQGVKTTGDKEVRANPLSTQAQAGNVRLVRGPWINAFLDEAELFPNGAHDDMVDAASGAMAELSTPEVSIRWISRYDDD
jgi:predicted phage terminase large subunit-like protein